MPVSGERSAQGVRDQPILAPVSSTLKPGKGPRALDFLCVGFGVIISDKQSPSQKRLISYL